MRCCLKNVDYAVLYLNQDGIGGTTVQLVDSPGTENSQADTEAARDFAKTTSAIVYMINATTPFVQKDKEYIASHYADKHFKNIFFVINRIDSVSEEEEKELREKSVPEQLRHVYTREDGSFDEQLFRRRVFYTNAYGALQTRQGLPSAKFMGQPIYLTDEQTGVPQFEDALADFLTSDGRDKAAFQSYMPRLAGMYLAAELEIEKILARYSADLDDLKADKEKIKANEEKCRRILEAILTSCKNTVRGIIEDGRREYTSTVNRINAGWKSHFQDADIRFGIGQIATLVANRVVSLFDEKKAAEQLKKAMQPFSDAVDAYVKSEMSKMETNMQRSVDVRLKELSTSIEQQSALLDSLELPITMDDIAASLAQAFHVDVSKGKGIHNNANLFQVLLGVILLDPETIGKGAAGGNGNGKMIAEALVKNVVEFIAWYVVAWPIGIAMLVARVVQMVREGRAAGNDGAMRLLDGMRDAVITELTKGEDLFASGLENKLAVILRAGNTMTSSIKSMVDDYIKKLEDAIEAIDSSESAAVDEKKRTDNIRTKLFETLNALHELLYDKSLTIEEIKDLAVEE